MGAGFRSKPPRMMNNVDLGRKVRMVREAIRYTNLTKCEDFIPKLKHYRICLT